MSDLDNLQNIVSSSVKHFRNPLNNLSAPRAPVRFELLACLHLTSVAFSWLVSWAVNLSHRAKQMASDTTVITHTSRLALYSIYCCVYLALHALTKKATGMTISFQRIIKENDSEWQL